MVENMRTKIVADIRVSIKRCENGYVVDWNAGMESHGSTYCPTLDEARNKAYDVIKTFDEMSFY